MTKKNPELESSLLRYYRKLNQCNLIISRIQNEGKQYSILHEKERSKLDQTTGLRELTSEEFLLHRELITISLHLHFDIEDFFIHAKILLDRLAQILGYFFKNIPNDAKTDFTKHRKYFLEHDHNDVEYLDYIREKTKWFPLMLSVFRNTLIVHDKITNRSGSKYSWKDDKHGIFRLKSPNENQTKEITSLLNQIKESHKHDMLDIQGEVNIWSILEKLDQNADKLTHNEVKTLLDIHQQIGGEFPDVGEVIVKI